MPKYYDLDGNELTHEELNKLLRKNVSPQYGWWQAKVPQRVGLGKPPPGVRQSKEIRNL